ncbi:hypothetical protein MUP77_05670 [Candidatus Bathyarchaeota archaeon]|nr:hypothetical protein [Candidatus Bathyarchaeota archaeon]
MSEDGENEKLDNILRMLEEIRKNNEDAAARSRDNRFIDKQDLAFSILASMSVFLFGLLISSLWDRFTLTGQSSILGVAYSLILVASTEVFQFNAIIRDDIQMRIVHWTSFWTIITSLVAISIAMVITSLFVPPDVTGIISILIVSGITMLLMLLYGSRLLLRRISDLWLRNLKIRQKEIHPQIVSKLNEKWVLIYLVLFGFFALLSVILLGL